MYYTHMDTPAGPLLLIGNGKTVSGIHWKVFKRCPIIESTWTEYRNVFSEVIGQLDDYFKGARSTFNFSYAAAGTEFQTKVWRELEKIPYGVRSSYQAIATAIGKPKAVRAVGTAIGSNPISIVVPCHRVLTSSNKLGGYAGGLDSKALLLKIEGTPITN